MGTFFFVVVVVFVFAPVETVPMETGVSAVSVSAVPSWSSGKRTDMEE